MKQLLGAVEVDDRGDDVQVLASTHVARLIVSGEMKIVVVAVLKHETWAVCGRGAVVSGVDEKVKACFVGVVRPHAGDISIELNGTSLVLRCELFDGGVIWL